MPARVPGPDAVAAILYYSELAEAEQQQLQRSLTMELGNLVIQEYQRGVRERADISVL